MVVVVVVVVVMVALGGNGGGGGGDGGGDGGDADAGGAQAYACGAHRVKVSIRALIVVRTVGEHAVGDATRDVAHGHKDLRDHSSMR